jgi:hypothetical protein
MQANNIDSDSEHLSDSTWEGDVRGLRNAAVHELNQIRAEALRDIDNLKGGFSCIATVVSLPLLLARLFTVMMF